MAHTHPAVSDKAHHSLRFKQVARYEYGQAHIFKDGAIHAFFDTKRVHVGR